MSYIRLTTEIPGPKSKAILTRRAGAVPSGLGRATDVAIERAEGALVIGCRWQHIDRSSRWHRDAGGRALPGGRNGSDQAASG
jgi:hypothetical protein